VNSMRRPRKIWILIQRENGLLAFAACQIGRHKFRDGWRDYFWIALASTFAL